MFKYKYFRKKLTIMLHTCRYFRMKFEHFGVHNEYLPRYIKQNLNIWAFILIVSTEL